MLYVTWIARRAHSSVLILLMALSALAEVPINRLLSVLVLTSIPFMNCFLLLRLAALMLCGSPSFKNLLISMMH